MAWRQAAGAGRRERKRQLAANGGTDKQQAKERAEERLFADVVYVQLKDEARRALRKPMADYSPAAIFQLCQTMQGRDLLRKYIGWIHDRIPRVMEAKRNTTRLTVPAPMRDDVGLNWRLFRIVTFIGTRFLVGILMALSSYALRQLHSMDDDEARTPKGGAEALARPLIGHERFPCLLKAKADRTCDYIHTRLHHDAGLRIKPLDQAKRENMASTLQFIINAGEPTGNEKEQRKLIRAHAMRDFRRKHQMERKKTRPNKNVPCRTLAIRATGGDSREFKALQPSAAIMPNICSPALTRAALGQHIRATYFPSQDCYSPKILSTLELYSKHKSPALLAATDALALLQLGSASGDGRILLEARQRHQCALQLLQSLLRDPNVDLTAALGTAQNLAICQMYSAVAAGEDAWSKHVDGVLVLSRMLKDKSSEAPLDTFLQQNALIGNMISALVSRQPLDPQHVVSNTAWPRVPGNMLLGTLLKDLPFSVLRVTRAISRSDEVCRAANPTSADIQRILRTLGGLDCELSDCRKLACPNQDETPDARWTPEADDWWQSSALVVASRQSSKQESVLTLLYSCFNMIMRLLLCQSIMDCALTPAGHLVFYTEHQTVSEYITRATKIADELCCTATYLSADAAGDIWKASAMRAPLYFASSWYERSGDREKIAWCKGVESIVRKEAPYLEWDALMPWSLLVMNWL